jgi:hypothetical protein
MVHMLPTGHRIGGYCQRDRLPWWKVLWCGQGQTLFYVLQCERGFLHIARATLCTGLEPDPTQLFLLSLTDGALLEIIVSVSGAQPRPRDCVWLQL